MAPYQRCVEHGFTIQAISTTGADSVASKGGV